MSCCIYLAAFRSRLKTASPRHKQRGREGLTWLHPARRPRAPHPLDIVSWISGSGKMRLTLMRLHFLNGRQALRRVFRAFPTLVSVVPRTTHVWNATSREESCQCVLYMRFFFFSFFASFYLDDNTLQNTFFPPFSFEFNIRSIIRFERFVTIHIGCDELTFKTGRILFLFHTNSANQLFDISFLSLSAFDQLHLYRFNPTKIADTSSNVTLTYTHAHHA